MLIGLQRFKPMVGCQQANTSLERNVGKCYSYLEVHLRPLNSKPLYGQDSLGMVAVGEGIILIQEIGGTLTFWTKYPETQCL
jgi:hypothetical protein